MKLVEQIETNASKSIKVIIILLYTTYYLNLMTNETVLMGNQINIMFSSVIETLEHTRV